MAKKATAVSEQPSFSHFVRLPVEIRENVYEHAMRATGPFETQERAGGFRNFKLLPGSSHLSGICSLNKLERSIAIPVFLCNTTLFLSPSTDTFAISMWLKRVAGTEEKGFATIKRINLSWKAITHKECAYTITF